MLCGSHGSRCFHVVAYSAHGGQSVLCPLPVNCDLSNRLVKDAILLDSLGSFDNQVSHRRHSLRERSLFRGMKGDDYLSNDP